MTLKRLRNVISFLVAALLLFGGTARAQRSADSGFEVFQIDAAAPTYICSSTEAA